MKPNQIAGFDQIIPPNVLREAKGLAIITVLKAGFLFSGRAGLGVIVARLPDGSWSPPLAIFTTGAGVGGQIGAEITDFVFILNTKSAVDSFAQIGSVTLGTNVSIAAGPVGRNAEAAGTASLRSASAIFAYSKTKGLFAGVSLEGLAIVERRDANRKFYGGNVKARNILAGDVEAPPACDTLMRILASRVFSDQQFDGDLSDGYYSDIPDDFDGYSSTLAEGGRARSNSRRSNRRVDSFSGSDSDDGYSAARSPAKPSYKKSLWQDNSYDQARKSPGRKPTYESAKKPVWQDNVYDQASPRNVDDLSDRFKKSQISNQGSSYQPQQPRPNNGGQGQAIALYTFKGEQQGDLTFRKGDVIEILKRSDTADDWWTGHNNGSTGIFPANYVELL